MIFHIDRSDDPRIAAFLGVRDRDLTGRQGLIMVEGEVLLHVLLSTESRAVPRAILLSARQYERLAQNLSQSLAASNNDPAIYVAPQAVLDRIVGFPLHRGILALAERPAATPLADWSAAKSPILVAIGIGNHDNMGGLFRNAAAFGIGGVVLDRTCCDPFYRKSIRVSAGAALRLPYVHGGAAHELLDVLDDLGFRAIALSPSGHGMLWDADVAGPTALVVGSEGPGLPDDVLARCETVRIPMAGGVDSLNVATAAALAMDHFTRHQRG